MARIYKTLDATRHGFHEPTAADYLAGLLKRYTAYREGTVNFRPNENRAVRLAPQAHDAAMALIIEDVRGSVPHEAAAEVLRTLFDTGMLPIETVKDTSST